MASLTQKMIGDVFMQLLMKKNLDKITVREIVDRCDINRNTFYYHYSDIYDLFNSMLCAALSEIAKEISNPNDRHKAIDTAARFMETYKNAIKNAYYSSAGALMEEQIASFLDAFFISAAKQSIKKQQLNTHTDITFVAVCFRCATSGMIKNWLDDDKNPSPTEIFTRINKYMLPAMDAMLTVDAK